MGDDLGLPRRRDAHGQGSLREGAELHPGHLAQANYDVDRLRSLGRGPNSTSPHRTRLDNGLVDAAVDLVAARQ